MNDIATKLVDKKIEFLTLLPEAISDIVADENVKAEKDTENDVTEVTKQWNNYSF